MRTLCMGAPGGLYRPTPGGTMVIRLGVGPSRLSHRPPSSPPTTGARRLAGPAGESGTVAVLLVTQARSLGRGNSATVYWAITVVTPHLVWLMARGTRGRGRPTLGSRLPRGRLRGISAVFHALTDKRVPLSSSRTGRSSWPQCAAHCGRGQGRHGNSATPRW